MLQEDADIMHVYMHSLCNFCEVYFAILLSFLLSLLDCYLTFVLRLHENFLKFSISCLFSENES